jgi:tRNA threonylcarbamoyladenosine biosynthesis protein TsaB
MILLAIETSVAAASLCLADTEEILFSTTWQAERNHDAHLFPALQKALDSLPAGSAPDYVLVGAGPGSYGGVRVALAAGVGIAAVTGAALVAVESWAQLAEGKSCVVADARRGGWTVRHPDGTIEVLTPEQLAELKAPLYSVEKPGIVPAAQKEGLTPHAEGLVRTWLKMTPEEQAAAAARPAEPIYVRPPHITKATRKPWER